MDTVLTALNHPVTLLIVLTLGVTALQNIFKWLFAKAHLPQFAVLFK